MEKVSSNKKQRSQVIRDSSDYTQTKPAEKIVFADPKLKMSADAFQLARKDDATPSKQQKQSSKELFGRHDQEQLKPKILVEGNVLQQMQQDIAREEEKRRKQDKKREDQREQELRRQKQ